MSAETLKENLDHARNHFSIRLFLRGLIIVAALYGLLLGITFVKKGSFEEEQIAMLPNKTAIIEQRNQVATIIPDDNKPAVKHSKFANGQPLPSVPVTGLYTETIDGFIPNIRQSDGVTPFDTYKRPFDKSVIGSKPVVALGLYDVGLSQIASESALKSLPPEISFIVSPYAQDTNFWVRQARSYGHEVWLTLPVETEDYPHHDPGAHTMLINTPIKENQEKLSWLMGSSVGYAGFVTPHNPAFFKSLQDTRPIVTEIAERGLGLINGSQYSSTVLNNIFLGLNAPYGEAAIWIDMPPSK